VPERLAGASQASADGPEDPATGAPAPRRPSPAQVNGVVAALTAAQGRAPSVPELVAALRERFGISRATAYRALPEYSDAAPNRRPNKSSFLVAP
jgi:hypothetical protein